MDGLWNGVEHWVSGHLPYSSFTVISPILAALSVISAGLSLIPAEIAGWPYWNSAVTDGGIILELPGIIWGFS